MKTNIIYQGDCLEVMRNFPDDSIDMCMTSPPYWGLRDYGVDGQYGLEESPEKYIEKMTDVFSEVRRILKKEGTLWLNIGDTYRGSCQGGGDTGLSKERYRKELLTYVDKPQKKMMPKCLMMIPERLAWSLIQDGWILRNKIIWYKPNSIPSSVKDRFSNKWEYLFMFSKQQKYYFDLEAIREPYIGPMNRWGGNNLVAKGQSTWDKGTGQETYRDRNMRPNPNGKNPGDVFTIPTCPFPEAHFAVFPEKLCEKPIKAGSPEWICKKCGKTRERIVEKINTGETQKMPDYWDSDPGSHGTIHRKGRSKGETGIPITINKTIGWTKCDCNAGFNPGIVLDPFSGAGTTLFVAKELRRKYIGIELNPDYCKIAEERLRQKVFDFKS